MRNHNVCLPAPPMIEALEDRTLYSVSPLSAGLNLAGSIYKAASQHSGATCYAQPAWAKPIPSIVWNFFACVNFAQ